MVCMNTSARILQGPNAKMQQSIHKFVEKTYFQRSLTPS
jgi:hypothetical protein